jgi:hypothetical protein
MSGYDAVAQAVANTSALTSMLGTAAAPTLDNHRDTNGPRSIINSDPPAFEVSLGCVR